jgi:hypothetical protein
MIGAAAGNFKWMKNKKAAAGSIAGKVGRYNKRNPGIAAFQACSLSGSTVFYCQYSRPSRIYLYNNMDADWLLARFFSLWRTHHSTARL